MNANGTVENKEGTVYIADLDIFVFVKFVDDSPAVLSLGRLCETMGHSYSWKAGEQPSLINDGVTFNCRSENNVPVVAVTRQEGKSRANMRRLHARLRGQKNLKLFLFVKRANDSKPTSTHTQSVHSLS